MKPWIFTIVTIACCTLIISYFIGTTANLKDAISSSAEAITAITGVITVLVGYYIYKDLGLNKKFKEQQYQIVTEYLAELKSINFNVGVYDDNDSMIDVAFLGFSTDIFEKLLSEPVHTRYLDLVLGIDFNNYSTATKKLYQLRNNLYMPKELATALLKFEISSATTSTNKIPLRMAVHGGEPASNFLIVPKKIGQETGITFRDYIETVKEALECLTEWIDKHTNDRGKLNI